MKQEYVFEDDLSLWELYRTSLYQTPRIKRIRWIFYFIPAVFILNAILNLLLLKGPVTDNWLYNIITIVMPFLMLCALYFIGTFLICLILKIGKPAIFTRITYHFTHWGMFKKNKAFDYSCQWRNIIKVKETKSWILLYTTEAGAHVIKKNLFNHKNELDMFLAFVKSKVSKE